MVLGIVGCALTFCYKVKIVAFDSPYDKKKVRKALLELRCNGAEGHSTTDEETAMNVSIGGVYYAGFRCNKCGGVVLVPETSVLADTFMFGG